MTLAGAHIGRKEYDFTNQFWSQIQLSPGGPSPRWGASGGTDPRALPVSDPIVPGPNNTFYMVGGFDGTSSFPLSDAWIFKLAGVLTPNNPNNTVASWSSVKINSIAPLPSKVRQGGVVMPSARVVAVGGCMTNDFVDNVCAEQDSYVLNIDSAESISPSGCPAPRVGPVLIPNYNRFANNFASQTFMALGTFNNSFWDDDNGLTRGEVVSVANSTFQWILTHCFNIQAVLDIETGTWARLLPAGDPGNTPDGPLNYPLPREGAAAISFPSAIVGSNPSVGSDTVIFGGQLANGTYMSDVWLLRAYMGAITESNQTWSGFGDGTLQTGQDASGAGVSVQYMSACAKATAPPPATGQPPPNGTPSPPDSSGSSGSFAFDTSATHKALSPTSIALILGAIAALRYTSPSVHEITPSRRHNGLVWVGIIAACSAYVMGIVGFVVSFTSITSMVPSTALRKRAQSSSNLLQTTHARAGFALFMALYVVFPILVVILWCSNTRRPLRSDSAAAEPIGAPSRKDSVETGITALTGSPAAREKSSRRNASPAQSTIEHLNESASPPRRRAISWQGMSIFPPYFRKSSSPHRSSESADDSPASSGPARSFEVLNRGPRVRRQSGYGINGHADGSRLVPRSLSDLSWLDRRRSLNVVVRIHFRYHIEPTQLLLSGRA